MFGDAATTSRTLLLVMDFLDVLKIVLLASFASVAAIGFLVSRRAWTGRVTAAY